jgi:hypothetical protein
MSERLQEFPAFRCGSITIPHLRRALATLDDVEQLG